MQNKTMTKLFCDKTDEELAGLSAESADALDALISRYTRLVRVCARPMFLTGADHEDLVQEGMIGLLYAIRSFNGTSGVPFGAYASVCIRRKMISAIRAASAQKHAPLNDSVSLHTFSFDDTVLGSSREDPESAILNRETFREIITALHEKLSASERDVLRLYLDGLSYSEIASRLSKPQKSVDNAVQRIRRKVEQIYGENGFPV